MPKNIFRPEQIACAPHTEKSTHMLVFGCHDCAGGAPIVDTVNDPKSQHMGYGFILQVT